MKITYDLKTTELNHHFIDSLQAIYGDQELEIIVDEKPTTPEQKSEITPSDNPWLKYAGTFKDDPQYDARFSIY